MAVRLPAPFRLLAASVPVAPLNAPVPPVTVPCVIWLVFRFRSAVP